MGTRSRQRQASIRTSPRRSNRSSPRQLKVAKDDEMEEDIQNQLVISVPKTKEVKKSIKLIMDSTLTKDMQEHTHSQECSLLAGRLSAEDGDVSLSKPTTKDRRRFQAAQQETHDTSLSIPNFEIMNKKTLDIKCLHLGISNVLVPWYSAPFPAEYYTKDGQLWMCEWCLKYSRTQRSMKRHVKKCNGRPPPGNEIYRHENLSIFEVDGRASKPYCQNLCLLAKMFLDHKTLYYDTETFLFYVLVEWHPIQTINQNKKRNSTLCNYSLVGYFSKEKLSPSNYNVSCILTLPNHQRKGYGHFLIDFSYLLSRKEKKRCSPEKPLSDLGLMSYVSYWSKKVFGYIHQHRQDPLNIEAICDATGLTVNDVLGVLEHHNFVRWCTESQSYEIVIDEERLSAFCGKLSGRSLLEAKAEHLRWIPYTCSR